MIWTLPHRTLWWRWNAIACAIAILVWSTPEEDRLIFPALLGVWLAVSIVWRTLTNRFAGQTLRGVRLIAAAALSGAASGALSSICAVLLMIFKDARHAHLYPEYPPVLLGAMLARLPAWTLAGLLLALGLILCLSTLRQRHPDAVSPDSPVMI